MNNIFAFLAQLGLLIQQATALITKKTAKKLQWILLFLEVASRAAIAWIVFTGFIAMVLPPRWAQNIIPIITLLPVGGMLYLATNKWAIGKTILVESLPASIPYLGPLIDKMQEAIRIIMLVLGAEVAVGIYLSIVPISNDRWLVPLLLACVAAGICFALGGRQGIGMIFFLGAVAITAIFFLGGRDETGKIVKVAVYGETVQAVGFNPDPEVICQTVADPPQGHRLIIPLHKGCWTRFTIPNNWAGWISGNANDNEGDSEDWVSFWYENWRQPSRPAPLDVDHGQWTTGHTGKVQGHGVLTLTFTN
jgi:hypothetical protein